MKQLISESPEDAIRRKERTIEWVLIAVLLTVVVAFFIYIGLTKPEVYNFKSPTYEDGYNSGYEHGYERYTESYDNLSWAVGYDDASENYDAQYDAAYDTYNHMIAGTMQYWKNGYVEGIMDRLNEDFGWEMTDYGIGVWDAMQDMMTWAKVYYDGAD